MVVATRRRIGGLILLGALIAPAAFSAPPVSVVAIPPQPGWASLTTAQRAALMPLAGEWDALENYRKKKWLGIAERYPRMSEGEQQRAQERMREWVRITPEQRSRVRDSYKEFNQLSPEQREAVKKKWQSYSNLSEADKEALKRGEKLPPKPAPEAAAQPTPEESSPAASLPPPEATPPAEGSTPRP